MYYKLQQLFVWILNPIYEKITWRIPDVVRNIIISVCFALMFLFQIFKRSSFSVWEEITPAGMALIGWLLLGTVIIMSINCKLVPIGRYNKFVELLPICGIIIILISFLHPVGYGFIELAVTIAVGFPCLYCVWENRKDYNFLFELVAKSIIVVGGIYFLYCLMLQNLDDSVTNIGRYSGTMNNPNVLGMVCAVVICMVLYLVLNNNNGFSIYVLIGGGGFMYLWLCASRTSILAAFTALVVFVVYFIKTKVFCADDKSKMLVKLFILLNIVAISIIAGSLLNRYIYEEQITAFENSRIIPVCYTAQINEETVSDTNPNSVAYRMTLGEKDINKFTSGRIGVWTEYIKKLNLFGNDVTEFVYYNGMRMHGPHNTALDFAYRTGIINGLIVLIFEIITCLYSMIIIFKYKYKEPSLFFSAVSSLIFFVYSFLEIALFPFTTPPVLLYYIGIAPLFFIKIDFRNKRKVTNDDQL